MIFTSYSYLIFVFAAFLIHWNLPGSWRNGFLLVASYAFYCSWGWQYGFLLVGVSIFNWAFALFVLARAGTVKALTAGIVVNLLPLVSLKYAGFLVSNATGVARLFDASWGPTLPAIALPIGISFFTFSGIAYLVDVAAGEEPFARASDYLLFNGFWPKLIAGPIVRASEARAAICSRRHLAYAEISEGVWRILSGFAKKVLIADTLSPIADLAYLHGASPNALDSIFGTLAFGLQIYFDFSGYSDIAIGTALLFGFRFPENFDWPYLSCSPREFWNRWHKTLSRWIRDYVFTPMTFAARRRPETGPLWLVVAMAVCGLWHGAQWTFILWGVWHGLLLVSGQTVLRGLFYEHVAETRPRVMRRCAATAITFVLVSAGWILFRAESLAQVWDILFSILTLRGGLRPGVLRENAVLLVAVIFCGLAATQMLRGVVQSWADRPRWFGLAVRIAKPVFYVALIIGVVVFEKEAQTFVYFQF